MQVETDFEYREKIIFQQYQNVIAPFIAELEVRDTEYPIEIFNEIRAIFTHLSRYRLNGSTSNIAAAERHVKRAILDCFKYLCISIAEKVSAFRMSYRNVDLKLADNGKFLPELDRLETLAKKAFIEAKIADVAQEESDDQLYELYEVAYNQYSELDKFLDASEEAILFASSHSKKSNLVTWISTAVTIVSIVIAVVAWVL